MAPINIVIVVITVIESLRAFDIAYIINRGKNGLELLSTLITNNSISESNRVGFGSAIAVVLLVISLGPIILFLTRVDAGGPADDRSRDAGRAADAPTRLRSRGGSALHAFLLAMAILWLFPLALGRLHVAAARIADTLKHGYISLPNALTLDNYITAWTQAELPHYYLNTLIIVVPAVILTLLARVDGRVRGVRASAGASTSCFLMLFTAGNLLPPQVIIVPLYRMYLLCRCPSPERQRTPLRPVHRDHPDPHRLPDGLLRLRAEQLHEDAAAGAHRGRARRRRRRSGGSTGA